MVIFAQIVYNKVIYIPPFPTLISGVIAVFKRKKPSSLKWKLLILVSLCWIIPVVAIGSYCYVYYVKSVNEKTLDTLSNEIYYSACVVAGNIDSVIKTSRSVTYDNAVEDAYKIYLRGNSQARQTLCQRINRYLYSRNASEPLIRFSAVYFTENPEQLYCHSGVSLDYSDAFLKETLPKISEFSEKLGSDVGFATLDGRIYIVKNLFCIIPERGYLNYATVVLELNSNEVFRELDGSSAHNFNTHYFVNNCTVLNDGSETPLTVNERPDKATEKAVTRRDDEFIFTGSVEKNDFDFGYSTAVSADLLNEQIRSYMWIVLALSAVILPILLASLAFFYKNFTSPLNRLVEAGQRLENGEFGYQISSKGINSEFTYLILTFNRMSTQIQRLFDKVNRIETASHEARIIALQSQINPHFLNNTLELMNWQARFAGDTAVSKMIESLSTLMDAALDRSGRRVVPLSEELLYADAYLYIINQRFGKRLTVHKDVDESLLEQEVPPLIIQPLLENAVEHGIEPVTRGNIYIKVYREGDLLNIEIMNDGEKLSEEDLSAIKNLLGGENGEKPKSSTSLGIRNVNDRLKLICGEHSGLSIFTDESGHTLSKVVIPMGQTEQKNTTNVNFR